MPARFFGHILESWTIDVDGMGRVVTPRACISNASRRPGLTQQSFEALVHTALGIWLAVCLAADHTDGHVDNLARFIAPGRVTEMAPSGDDEPKCAAV